MRLILPCIGEPAIVDRCLIQLAGFLGISCEQVELGEALNPKPHLFADSCLLVNTRVVEDWCTRTGRSPRDLTGLAKCWPRLLVYGLRAGCFDALLVRALSRDAIKEVRPAAAGASFHCLPEARPFCGPFAGLTFGRADAAHDHVLVPGVASASLQPLLALGDLPFAALVKELGEEPAAVFLASNEVADLEMPAGDLPLADYFSRFLPYVMALRYFAGDACWRAVETHATVIIDDPLLHSTYGFLNFRSLVRTAEEHNFHAAVAFIPHNFRRSSRAIVRLFHDNQKRLSLCFHGNDHTRGEFALRDRALLGNLLQVAANRMAIHQRRTGLACGPIMVFPQGRFSVEAMEVLASQDFSAAVNSTPYPAHAKRTLTLRELAQPAVLSYGGFPLFLRRFVPITRAEDLAFDVFFGRPLFFVTHHQDFEHQEKLLGVIDQINQIASCVQWSSLDSATSHSLLRRQLPDGAVEYRGYARRVTIPAASGTESRFLTWSNECASVARVLVNGCPGSVVLSDGNPTIALGRNSGQATVVSLVSPHTGAHSGKLDLKWKAKAIVRRRLSEFRDNYLYKNNRMLDAARMLQRRMSRT